jgi:hypothetical protein
MIFVEFVFLIFGSIASLYINLILRRSRNMNNLAVQLGLQFAVPPLDSDLMPELALRNVIRLIYGRINGIRIIVADCDQVHHSRFFYPSGLPALLGFHSVYTVLIVGEHIQELKPDFFSMSDYPSVRSIKKLIAEQLPAFRM